MSRRSFGVLFAVLLGLVAVALVAPVWWLEVDESAVPPSADVPSLPVGVTIEHEEVACGSGGCWRALMLRGPEHQSPAELAASVGLPRETCRVRSLLDLRKVCSGVGVVGERVVLYVQFHRPLGL